MPPVRKRAAKKRAAKKTTSARKASSATKRTAAKTGTSAKKTTSARKTTTARKAPSAPKAVEDAAERIRALNEQIIERSRSAGLAYLDSYERALTTIADYQRHVASAAEGGRADWFATLLKAQADFTRDLTETVATYVRKSLR